MAENVAPLRRGGRGGFFAVDRRAWEKVCDLGLNPMVAYLVLARGTGADQRTTAWSVNAVEAYTGIGRPRAKGAIDALAEAGLLAPLRRGSRPRYYLQPPTKIRGCQCYQQEAPSEIEAAVLRALEGGWTWIPATGKAEKWGTKTPCRVAAALAEKRLAERDSCGRWRAIPYDAEAAASPQWIWLPNEIIDGAAGEVPPLELVRQTLNQRVLRLLVALYAAHDLSADGGINWRVIRQEFTRQTLGERGEFVVYGFEPGYLTVWPDRPIVRPFLTGQMVPQPGGGERDAGLQEFWAALQTLNSLGLTETIGHLVSSDDADADVIHPYAVANGEPAERRLGTAAHAAGLALLQQRQADAVIDSALRVVPVRRHIAAPMMFGLIRLTYRPKTSATAAWFGRMAEWDGVAAQFETLAQRVCGPALRGNMQHQG